MLENNNLNNLNNGENTTPENNGEGYRWNQPAPESASYHAGRDQQPDEPTVINSYAENADGKATGDDTKQYNAKNTNNGSAAANGAGGEGYHPFGDNVTELKPKTKNKTNGFNKRMVAFALACSLCGGVVGAGIVGVANGFGSTATVSVSNRTPSAVKTVAVDGMTAMTPAEAYAANVNAVVSINVSENSTNIFGQVVQNASSGSGFVIADNGYIVTNYHVVKGASAISVTTYDGTDYDATYIGGDEENDIAVIKIDAKDLSTVVIGDSDKVNVGDQINAIGNPLGELTFSLTTGAVSSSNRAIEVDGQSFKMIQVDSAINPGNSGGPLINAYGEVIGIVSAKYTDYYQTTVEGIGFAIPINTVWSMIEDIIDNGYVTDKPYIGISAETVTADMAKQYNLVQGVYVYSVEKSSAAEKAGLQAGDIITAVDDTKVSTLEDLTLAKKSYKAGETCTLAVYRGGNTISVDFTFGKQSNAPQESTAAQTPSNSTQNGNNGYYYYYDNGSSSSGQNA